jgi:hypothetical protein
VEKQVLHLVGLGGQLHAFCYTYASIRGSKGEGLWFLVRHSFHLLLHLRLTKHPGD